MAFKLSTIFESCTFFLNLLGPPKCMVHIITNVNLAYLLLFTYTRDFLAVILNKNLTSINYLLSTQIISLTGQRKSLSVISFTEYFEQQKAGVTHKLSRTKFIAV